MAGRPCRSDVPEASSPAVEQRVSGGTANQPTRVGIQWFKPPEPEVREGRVHLMGTGASVPVTSKAAGQHSSDDLHNS